MTKPGDSGGARCSFCGKHQREVGRIIASALNRFPPTDHDVYICNECVEQLWEIEQITQKVPPPGVGSPP